MNKSIKKRKLRIEINIRINDKLMKSIEMN